MQAFRYRAVDVAGKARSGVLEAVNAAGARASLRDRGLLPLSVDATAARDGAGGAAEPGLLSRLRPALGPRGLALVTRQLATLIGAGLRIEDALRTVARQTAAPRAASVLLNVRAAIMDGRGFAEALGDAPQVFPEFYRASIAAGEQSGRLDTVMEHLADFVETRRKTRQSVQLALIYPALLAVVSLGIITLLLTYVVPDIVGAFAARGAELPLITRGMIALSEAINRWGGLTLCAAAVGAIGFGRWLRAPAARRRFDRFLTRRRLTGRVVRQRNAAQFAGTLATVLQSGAPLLDSLRTAAAATPNTHIRERIEAVTERVRTGGALGQALGDAGVFPPMLVAMAASGEASGQLGPALARAAQDQQRDLDAWIATLVALVEPAILLLMGGMVLVIVMAILTPIVGLNNLAGL